MSDGDVVAGDAGAEKRAVLIAGPTASGKSALALARAEQSGGVIINADSMQVYDVLDVLTARPPASDLARAEHRLYGEVPPQVRFSTGQWVDAVRALISEPEIAGRELIFVGGTGLYFEALINGISDVPPVPEAAVAEAEALVAPLDRAGRRALIADRDPATSAQLVEPDPQRVVRALSVLSATGRSLAEWQGKAGPAVLDGFTLERIVLDVDRDVLAERIARRFEAMMGAGAVEEVKALLALELPKDLPAMKAIGVSQIADMLAGRLSRDEATERAAIATRQYAKRQRTWFRQRMSDWRRIPADAVIVDLQSPDS